MIRPLFHAALTLLPKRATIPILAGPVRGMRWRIASSGVTQYWRGTYETQLAAQVAAVLRPGDVAYDIGAHVGYFTLLFARRVGATGQVVAFEPTPASAASVRDHIRLNGLGSRVAVHELALSVVKVSSDFVVKGGSSESMLINPDVPSPPANLRVRTTTLDAFLASGAPIPNFLKIDVETAEQRVLTGARETITRHRPTIALSVHSMPLHNWCHATLASWGYTLAPLTTGGWDVLATATGSR